MVFIKKVTIIRRSAFIDDLECGTVAATMTSEN